MFSFCIYLSPLTMSSQVSLITEQYFLPATPVSVPDSHCHHGDMGLLSDLAKLHGQSFVFTCFSCLFGRNQCR